MFSQFGTDPLQQYPNLKEQREIELLRNCNFDYVFHNIVNGNQQPFIDGLLCFINISDHLTQQVTVHQTYSNKFTDLKRIVCMFLFLVIL